MKRLLPLVLLLIGCEAPFEAATVTSDAGASASAAGSSSHAGTPNAAGAGATAGKGGAGAGGASNAGAAGAGAPSAGSSSEAGAAGDAPVGVGGSAAGGTGGSGGGSAGSSDGCTAPYAAELGVATTSALPDTAPLLVDFTYCERMSSVHCTERPKSADPTCELTWGVPAPSSDGSAVTVPLTVSCAAKMIETIDNATKASCTVGITGSGTVTLDVSDPVVSSGFVTWGRPTATSAMTWSFSTGCSTFEGNMDEASAAAKTAVEADLAKSLGALSLAETCE